MSLIPFPKIPNVLGAPIVKRILGLSNEINRIAAIVLNAQAFVARLLAEKRGSLWTVLRSDGKLLLVPDSVLAFECRNDTKVSDYPVDPNSFSSYNKVQSPFDIRLTMTCGGKGAMTREAFLLELDSMLADTKLYTLSTPDKLYDSCNLVHYDYKREAKSGVTLITVECIFTQIRTTARAVSKETQTASGADSKSLSMVTPSPATPAVTQSAAGAV